MHRILNIAGNEKNKDDLIEQPVADFIFITSVKADLNLISNLLLEKEFVSLKNNIRALEISNLNDLKEKRVSYKNYKWIFVFKNDDLFSI